MSEMHVGQETVMKKDQFLPWNVSCNRLGLEAHLLNCAEMDEI